MNTWDQTVSWQSGALILLGIFLLIAAWSDADRRRIPNTLVLVALSSGLIFHSMGPESTAGSGLFTQSPGALGTGAAVAGALLGLGIFFPFWLLRLLGAGDVKLLAAVGAFAGPEAFANIALFVFFAGGILALLHIFTFRSGRIVLQNTWLAISQLRQTDRPAFDIRTQTVWRMPYAVAIAAGVAAYAGWTLSGLRPILRF